jgi:hypothetical protein
MASQVARSTALDLLLWPQIKDLVGQTKVQDVDKLHRVITAACESVSPMILQALEERWSVIWTIFGSPEGNMCRYTEERQNSGT